MSEIMQHIAGQVGTNAPLGLQPPANPTGPLTPAQMFPRTPQIEDSLQQWLSNVMKNNPQLGIKK